MSYQLHFGCIFFIYHVKMINIDISKILKEIGANFCSFVFQTGHHYDKTRGNCKTGSQVPQLISLVF